MTDGLILYRLEYLRCNASYPDDILGISIICPLINILFGLESTYAGCDYSLLWIKYSRQSNVPTRNLLLMNND